MIEYIDIRLPIEEEANFSKSKEIASDKFGIPLNRIYGTKLIKRSIDARSKRIIVQLRFQVFIDEPVQEYKDTLSLTILPSNAKVVHIIGAGPAGLFAALQLIEKGIKPILFERGKDVRQRRRDLAKLNREGIVNPESNYCFGEGGAGTYSDGKLYTRSKKRGDVNYILSVLRQFGADESIEIEAHPHIGTNKLPNIIVTIREAIIHAGGEVHFGSKLTDLLIEKNKLVEIEINNSEKHEIDNLILATGHSARDIFELLHQKNIAIEAKPFALGVRVEHSQELINKVQYHNNNNELLPPASYKLVTQVENHGVYSFCMCPGGIIAPCATDNGEIVTNGWSPSRRNNPYANSGIVVEVNAEDWQKFGKDNPLAALELQREVEKKAFAANNRGDKGQIAPAQRLKDFTEGKLSEDLPKCSYQPGLKTSRLDEILPKQIAIKLQKAFIDFGKKMRGYLTNDAIIVGVESRTSSPVKIPRDPIDLNHTQIKNLYPCGEGAGYAGGIVSAAIDGVKIADTISLKPY